MERYFQLENYSVVYTCVGVRRAVDFRDSHLCEMKFTFH